MAFNFKTRIEDLSGAIPASGDGLQWLEDGIYDVLDKVTRFIPNDLPLFAQEVTVGDGGLEVTNNNILDVHRDSVSCRIIPASGRHAAADATSIDAATNADPVAYIHNRNLFVKPSGGTTVKAHVVKFGAINSWDSDTSSVDFFPTDKYNLLVLYASIQNILHRMVIMENDTGFPATALTTMTDSDWTEADWDFDDENIDYNTWFQLLGDMIQNQEDVELAAAQMQKLQTFFAGDQQQLQKIITRYQWLQGQLVSLKQQYNESFVPQAQQ
jgi:hypothetical protein